jgi:hypothetical protein
LLQIDSSRVTTKNGSSVFSGLPDTQDTFRYKDFFTMYLGMYCSGTKNGSHWKTNHCSEFGTQLFEQYRRWKTWDFGGDHAGGAGYGVSGSRKLIGVERLESVPIAIFVGQSILISLLAICTTFGFVSICVYWAKIVAIVASVVSRSNIFDAGYAHVRSSCLPYPP